MRRFVQNIALTLSAGIGIAEVGAAQQLKLPPVRRLPPPIAVSEHSFKVIISVRELLTGNVLISDNARRQLILVDSTLAPQSILIDSVAGSVGANGDRPAGIMRYVGDSTLFVEVGGLSPLMNDPAGRIIHRV